jgi:glutamyl-tRNA reductase
LRKFIFKSAFVTNLVDLMPQQCYTGVMMLIYQGITYRTCPLQIREKVALTQAQQQALLRCIASERQISDSLILSTCNRTEIYLNARENFDSPSFIPDLLETIRSGSGRLWKENCKVITGIEVAKHLFSVAAGLDSQMLGENQIISQLKNAYTMSIECQTSSFLFHRLLHRAFRASKAVRTNTAINCGAVSISLAAVELAKSKIKLPGAKVLLVGAGENAALAARYLLKAGIQQLIIASRTIDSAKDLAGQLSTGSTITLDQVPSKLAEADLLICSTASTEPVLTVDDCAYIIAQRQNPLLIVDIAVPRDVENEIGQLPGIDLYNIEHLNNQIETNKIARSSQIPKADAIIDNHVSDFAEWLNTLDAADVISNLTRKYLASAREHAKRYAKEFTQADADKLEIFAESLAKRILHGPISFIKTSDLDEQTPDRLQAADLINKMFLTEQQDQAEDS